jgi:hypothetical protein
LTEEADLDWFADSDTLSLLDEDLTGVLASIAAIQTRHTVLFRVIAFLEWLKGGHKVVPTCYAVCDDPLGDTCSDCTLDDGSHRVHRADHLCLILGRHMELDLLEEVF